MRSLKLAAAMLLLSALVGVSDASACSQTETLIAGQNNYAGTVEVRPTDDGTGICVTYQTDGDWLLTETHLSIATSLNGIPQTKAGNPRPGQFQYSARHNPAVPTFTYCVSYPYEFGDRLFIATHAVVNRSSSGGGSQTETAWGGGFDFPGSNWATYFEYEVISCEIDT